MWKNKTWLKSSKDRRFSFNYITNKVLELFYDMNVVVLMTEYFSWRCSWSKKKKKERKKERKAKTLTRTINGMTISGAFFLSCFMWNDENPSKELQLKFKVISQCKLLNLTLLSVEEKAGTRASERKSVPILEQEKRFNEKR